MNTQSSRLVNMVINNEFLTKFLQLRNEHCYEDAKEHNNNSTCQKRAQNYRGYDLNQALNDVKNFSRNTSNTNTNKTLYAVGTTSKIMAS